MMNNSNSKWHLTRGSHALCDVTPDPVVRTADWEFVTCPRCFIQGYLEARKAARAPEATMSETFDAQDLAAKISAYAERASLPIDEVALDEQARVELYGSRS